MALMSRPGDTHRLQAEMLASFWQPQPSHTFLETKALDGIREECSRWIGAGKKVIVQ